MKLKALAFALAIVLTIINKEGSPEVKLSWTIITMMLPVVGGLLYLFVEMQPGYRLLQRRLENIYKQTEEHVKQDEAVLKALEEAAHTVHLQAELRKKKKRKKLKSLTKAKEILLW